MSYHIVHLGKYHTPRIYGFHRLTNNLRIEKAAEPTKRSRKRRCQTQAVFNPHKVGFSLLRVKIQRYQDASCSTMRHQYLTSCTLPLVIYLAKRKEHLQWMLYII